MNYPTAKAMGLSPWTKKCKFLKNNKSRLSKAALVVSIQAYYCNSNVRRSPDNDHLPVGPIIRCPNLPKTSSTLFVNYMRVAKLFFDKEDARDDTA